MERRKMGALAAIFTALWPVLASGQDIEFDLPLRCDLSQNCAIQQFVDHQQGPGVRDYACRSATYNGHQGTDFRITSGTDFERGVPVVASATGRVIQTRNDQPDAIKRSADEIAATNGKECGNRVALDHGQGWQTDYCHLRKGSVRVRTGDTVEVGETIGFVGASGRTQFPHLHFSVRYRGMVVDPFRAGPLSQSCDISKKEQLWSAESGLSDYGYRATQVVNLGLADQEVTREQVDAGQFERFKPNKDSPLLIAFGRFINLEKGDRITLVLRGPDGVIAQRTYDPMPKNRAVEMRYLGKRRPQAGWPDGAYSAYAEITRGGETLDTEALARQSK